MSKMDNSDNSHDTMIQKKPVVVPIPRGRPPLDPAKRAVWENQRIEALRTRGDSSTAPKLNIVSETSATPASPISGYKGIRGQPPKDPVARAAYEARKAELKGSKPPAIKLRGSHHAEIAIVRPEVKPETNAETRERLIKSFNIAHDLVESAADHDMPSLILSGGGGVGKSYMVDETLALAQKQGRCRYNHIKAVITPLALYQLFYEHRASDMVLVLDDSDKIWFREDSLGLMKALLDSSPVRKVSWLTNTGLLGSVPTEYEYRGSCIFITNLDIDYIANQNTGKLGEHQKAILTRSFYFDLRLHRPRELAIWTEHVVKSKNLLIKQWGITPTMQTAALEYLKKHADEMREVSLRTAGKLGMLMKRHTATWQDFADRALLLSPEDLARRGR